MTSSLHLSFSSASALLIYLHRVLICLFKSRKYSHALMCRRSASVHDDAVPERSRSLGRSLSAGDLNQVTAAPDKQMLAYTFLKLHQLEPVQ